MHFILLRRTRDIIYVVRKQLLFSRSLLIGIFFGFCISQIYTFRHNLHKLLPRMFYKEIEINFDPVILNHNETSADRSMANKLYHDVKILCWIMTSPQNHETKAKHIQLTWGKRCNKLLLMSTEVDEKFDTIALPVVEGYNELWGKTKAAFKYIYNNHLNEYDWFLKADDDTYVVVENLRYMLYPYNPNTGLYFGCKFKPLLSKVYNSGGAGYVLSKESVKRLVEYSLTYPQYCDSNLTGSEDVKMGQCLKSIGIIAGNTRDSHKHGRFFPLQPVFHLAPYRINNFWYWNYIKYDWTLDCCSDYAISFHYIEPRQMYVLDYLIYHLKPFGIQIREKFPKKLKLKQRKHFKKLHLLNISSDQN